MKVILPRTLTLVLVCAVLFIAGPFLAVSPAHAAGGGKEAGPGIVAAPSPCNNYQKPWVELDSTSGVGCISGYGYYGLGDSGHIGDLNNVFFLSAQGSGGWIRYYNSSGGHYCNFVAGNYSLPDVRVTQVDIGGTQSGASGC